MSVKSRGKVFRREQEVPINILAQQKKTAAKAEKNVRENYLHSVFLVLISCIFLALMGKNAGRSMRDFLLIALFPMAVALWLLVSFFWRHRFLCVTGRVEHTSGEKREFICQRVRLVTYPVSRFVSEIAGLVLIAKGGKKYRYVFPQPQMYCWKERRCWKRLYAGQRIYCECYRDTNVIKSIDGTMPRE